MEVFYKYRGGLLTGGICIKEFLDLKYYGSGTNEYRVFYINHEAVTISRNSGQGTYTPIPPQFPGCRRIRIMSSISGRCISALSRADFINDDFNIVQNGIRSVNLNHRNMGGFQPVFNVLLRTVLHHVKKFFLFLE